MCEEPLSLRTRVPWENLGEGTGSLADCSWPWSAGKAAITSLEISESNQSVFKLNRGKGHQR